MEADAQVVLVKLPKRVVAARENEDGTVTRYFEPPWIEPHAAKERHDGDDMYRKNCAALRRIDRANKRTPS